jgi:hypothetical protein
MIERLITKEVQTSIIKGVIGEIPYIGSVLNEVIYESRARIKQERINKFISLLHDYMCNVSIDSIDFEYVKSDDFSDLFESVLKRVALTKSEEKMRRFKKVLVSEIQNPTRTDFVETFLDIITRLDEVQIKILNDIKIATKNCGGLHEKVFKLQDEISKIENDLSQNKKSDNERLIVLSLQQSKTEKENRLKILLNILVDNQRYYNSDNYGITHNQYVFYLQDLISKALLQERLIPRKIKAPFVTKIIELTTYGDEFLNFIQTEE